MTTARKRKDEQKPPAPPAGGQDGGKQGDAGVAESGDNRKAGDVDGNWSAGDTKSPGAKSPEVE